MPKRKSNDIDYSDIEEHECRSKDTVDYSFPAKIAKVRGYEKLIWTLQVFNGDKPSILFIDFCPFCGHPLYATNNEEPLHESYMRLGEDLRACVIGYMMGITMQTAKKNHKEHAVPIEWARLGRDLVRQLSDKISKKMDNLLGA